MRLTIHQPNYPDVGNGELPCCLGSAVYGPERCTCWESEHDQEQQPPKAGPRNVRVRMCEDCAFRPGSPERSGDARYEHSDEDGLDDVMRGEFVCHQGMRRLVREVHPSGAELVACPGAYEPGDPPMKADGSPADYCAGWWAAKQRDKRDSERGERGDG